MPTQHTQKVTLTTDWTEVVQDGYVQNLSGNPVMVTFYTADGSEDPDGDTPFFVVNNGDGLDTREWEGTCYLSGRGTVVFSPYS